MRTKSIVRGVLSPAPAPRAAPEVVAAGHAKVDTRRAFLGALMAMGPLLSAAGCGGGGGEAGGGNSPRAAEPPAPTPPSPAPPPPPATPAPATPAPTPASVVKPAAAGALPSPTTLRGPLPTWVPAAGNVATLSVANGLLDNSFASTVAPYYYPAYSVYSVNAYSGTVINPYYGTYGALVLEGGGHANSNDNSVFLLELGSASLKFRRVTDPTPLFGSDTSNDTRYDNSIASDKTLPLTNFAWAEYTLDGQPVARHSYGAQDVIGPEHGGAAHGTFMRVIVSAGAVHGFSNGEVAHMVRFDALGARHRWERAGQTPGLTGRNGTAGIAARCAPPNWTCFVPHQSRIYIESNGQGATLPPRWFDVTTQRYTTGTGLARSNDPDSAGGGMMFYVDWRQIVLHADVKGGNMRLRYMNVAVAQPSWVDEPRTLSHAIPLDTSWSAICWCPDNGRILVGNVLNDDGAVYEIEIPSDVDATWTVTRVPMPAGQTIAWAPYTTYKKWEYNPYVRSIVYLPLASDRGEDVVYVYRPRNT